MSRLLGSRYQPSWASDLAEASRLTNEYKGTPDDDNIVGSSNNDVFQLGQGGSDIVNGEKGDDFFYFGNSFTGADMVKGSSGFDYVYLNGDYSAGIDVQSSSLRTIETLFLQGGSYVITGELDFTYSIFGTIVDATFLEAGQDLNIEVSSRSLLTVRGGGGDDVVHAAVNGRSSHLVGNDGNDTLIGGAGSTQFEGSAGADRIVMANRRDIAIIGVQDSVTGSYDTIDNVTGSGGRIKLNFDSDTSTKERDSEFHVGKTADHAGDILFKYDTSTDETVVRIFTGHDKIADSILHLTGDVHLTDANFIFG